MPKCFSFASLPRCLLTTDTDIIITVGSGFEERRKKGGWRETREGRGAEERSSRVSDRRVDVQLMGGNRREMGSIIIIG
jgi:hypothetical protein